MIVAIVIRALDRPDKEQREGDQDRASDDMTEGDDRPRQYGEDEGDHCRGRPLSVHALLATRSQEMCSGRGTTAADE
jgi:hypothetical protein